jgi:single-strand DNA-binding protein
METLMANFNKVILMGNLTRDIELRHTANNMAIGKFGLAVNRKWKSAEGEMREEATFVDCDAFGRTAEIMSQYLSKGRPVFIEGHLRLDQWEDKDGQKRSKLKVVVDSFQFVDSKGGGGGGGGGGEAEYSSEGGGGTSRPAPNRAAYQPRNTGQRAPAAASSPQGPMPEDDIPF